MKITWFGQAFFQIQGEDGVRVVTDPYGEGIGYNLPRGLSADVVTVSHQHQDHNNVSAIAGHPKILQTSGASEVKGISFLGVPTFHDTEAGKKRGPNIVFTFSLNGIKISHLGDLGHILTPEQIAPLKNTDILMIPVGGTFTLGPTEALQVVNQLKPKVVIPMHYRLPGLIYPLATIDDFLAALKVIKLPSSAHNTLEISQSSLPSKTEVFVLAAQQ